MHKSIEVITNVCEQQLHHKKKEATTLQATVLHSVFTMFRVTFTFCGLPVLMSVSLILCFRFRGGFASQALGSAEDAPDLTNADFEEWTHLADVGHNILMYTVKVLEESAMAGETDPKAAMTAQWLEDCFGQAFFCVFAGDGSKRRWCPPD